MDEPHNSGQQHHEAGRDDLTGHVLGRFHVQARLGEGGMGEVYLARDTKLKRLVALKRIAPQWRRDPRFAERFRREVELASRLSHPHIAAVHDVFEYEGESFLVMEYVEGESLRRRLHGEPIPLEEFFEIARQCASALAAAHQSGVLHRDLKPENILITRDGQVKILDFGLGKALPLSSESTLATTEPGLKGTPGYMAPEALLEKEVDARADLFSLGVVFYEMLAGRHPFLVRGDSFISTVNRVLTATPKTVASLNANVTPQVEAIVMRLLEKESVARYVSAAQLGADLKAAAGGSTISSTVFALQRRTRRWKRVAAAVAAVVLVAAAGFWLFRRATRPVITASDWILMADFSNQSGKPIFDDTVTEALRDALEQSRRFRLVPQPQVIAAARLMGQGNVAKLSPSLGRQICQREGYRGLLTGGIRFVPPDYVLSLQIQDPIQGVPVYTDQARFREPAQLYPAVERLARRLREHLGESLADIRKTSTPLARVTTPSLQALQRYTRAVRLYNHGSYPDALALFQSAISLDSNFAMAHLYSAQIYDTLGNLSAEKVEMAKAMDGVTRVSERERHLIQAVNLEYQGDYAGAATQYRLLTEIYPNDLEAWKGLGESAENAGLNDQAIQAERHVLQLNPDSGSDYGRLIIFLDKAGHAHQALTVYQTARERGIDNPQLHRGAGVANMVLGNVKAAREEFALCNSSGNIYGQNFASLYQASLLLYEGRLSRAVDLLRAGIVLDIKMGSLAYTPLRRYMLGEALLAMGKTSEAQRDAQELETVAEKLDIPEAYTFVGLLALQNSRPGMAQAALSSLKKISTSQPNSAFASSSYQYLLGALELSQGHADQALRAEQRAYAFYAIPGILRVQSQAYAALKKWNKAAESYRNYLDQSGFIFNYYSPLDWVLAHLDLARALVHANQTQEAAKFYDAFLRLWAGADPDLPALRKAIVEKNKLEQATTLFPYPHSSPHSIRRGKRWQEKTPVKVESMSISIGNNGQVSQTRKCRTCSANT